MAKQKPVLSGTPTAWRIPKDLLLTIKQLADEETRSINGEAIVLLREALHARKRGVIKPTPAIEGQSVPPPHIARGRTPPPPPDKLQQIMDDEGWEGSDPKTLLAGTKA